MKVSPSLLKDILTLASTQVTELEVVPDETGWSTFALSDDHVSMVSIQVPVASFTEYGVIPRFRVNCSDLLKALKNFSAPVTFSPENGRLTLSDGHLTTRLPLLPVQDVEPRVPTLTLSAEVIVEQDTLKRIIGCASSSVPSLRFTMVPVALEIRAQDENGNGSVLALPADECTVFELEGDPVSTAFPLSHLDNFLKAVPKGTLLDVRYGQDLPMVIEFDEGFHCTWLVAPRVEEE